MRVYDDSIDQETRFTIQLNWSRSWVFSYRQRNWLREKAPKVRGVYAIYMDGYHYPYNHGRGESPVIYFGSGRIGDRLFSHLTRRTNLVLSEHLDDVEVPLRVRWAKVEDGDGNDWPVVAEAILVFEFERRFGDLPPANQIRPPTRPAFDFSYVNQHPRCIVTDP